MSLLEQRNNKKAKDDEGKQRNGTKIHLSCLNIDFFRLSSVFNQSTAVYLLLLDVGG